MLVLLSDHLLTLTMLERGLRTSLIKASGVTTDYGLATPFLVHILKPTQSTSLSESARTTA